jgi:hypothetical protein
MFQLTITEPEKWDEGNERFIPAKEHKLSLEHSLVSLSKWESKWCKPFLTNKDKPREEFVDYIRCMTITQNVNPEIYDYVTNADINDIKEYINAPMTATRFSKSKNAGGTNGEVATNETIYCQMIMLNIPPDYQKWHLNRLLTLIRVCTIKNQQPTRMSQRDILSQNKALNAARRKRLNTRG